MTQASTMVLVPTYMEAATICRLIDELSRHLPEALILILDDQSPDGTAEVVRTRYAAVPTVQAVTRDGPRAFGAAMREGMRRFLESGRDRLITIDADLSHDPALATRMLAAVDPAGLAIGSRYLGGRPRGEWAVGRMLTSMFGNHYIRAITGLPVRDCTSGFRCYSRPALERIELSQIRSEGYAFQVETLYWIWRAGCPVVEVPIVYRDRLYGESKLGPAIVVESLRLPWLLVRRASGCAPLKHTGCSPRLPVAPSPRRPR